MTVGDVMLLEVMATLGGGAPTLGGAATPTLRGGVLVGGELEGPAMMAVSWRMASKCFSLSLAVAGAVCLSRVMRLAAARMDLSCSNVTRSWQCVGYSCHVSENWNCHVAGM
jgi:hypothetical protein